MKFRSFRARLLTLILALTGVSQLASLAIVAWVHRVSAEEEIHGQLALDRNRFGEAVARRNDTFARSAEALSFDVGMRAAQAADVLTLRSALESFRGRVNADVAALLSDTGGLKAETRSGPPGEATYQPLFTEADNSESGRATGYGILDGEIYSLTVVPFRAPQPVAWIVVGFRLDEKFVDDFAQTTAAQITVILGDRKLATNSKFPEDAISADVPLPTTVGPPARIVLEYSLGEKMERAKRLERVLGLTGVGTLLIAAVLALAIARGVSQPVQQLAAHTRVIASGDYGPRLHLDRGDELGQLAESFNAMSAGLAERDQVRDLLDKNVSPEVAAQLMRDGAALGGEEREVTVLFADLRGFTPMSERRAPREVVALLNRYLDRMSGAIEGQGGVIDKFIGDEIMALFGAPVAQPDAADRALGAARDMVAALARFNAELAQEGSPPLAIGIGINTARVVAGNIGSHRRLNYSVIGDGVNVAARLQTLTRAPEHRATIIVSEATRRGARAPFNFRPLGPVAVKGRAEPVEVFAVEA